MSQFTLRWDNSKVVGNANATAQRALYRLKSVGGAYISAGFSPTNDLPTSATSIDTPASLPDNQVIQFLIQSICTSGGPINNDNGVKEGINFACLTPVLTKTDITGTATLDLTGTDITKVRFSLRLSSTNALVSTEVVVRSGNSIAKTVNGLSATTNYYWQLELYANIDNVEVISSDISNMGSICSPYPFTTNNPTVCNPVTSVTVSSIEIP